VVYLPPELHDSLRLQSARTGKTMSELVEQSLRTRLAPERRRTPLPSPPEEPSPEVVDALVKYGAPLWSSGRPTSLSLEEAIAQGLELARKHPSILRVLPVVLAENRSELSWKSLRERVGRAGLPALGMLLDVTAEVTDIEEFRAWAAELQRAGIKRRVPAPFFEMGACGERYLELARHRTPEAVRRWGFLMATPLDDFRRAVMRYCGDRSDQTSSREGSTEPR